MPGLASSTSTAPAAIAAASSSVDVKGKGREARAPAVPPKKYGFSTLKREKRFAHPSTTGHDVPELEELVAPHIASFDALFEDASSGQGRGQGGLLDLAVRDIDSRVVFDGKGKAEGKLGNKLECTSGIRDPHLI